MRRAVGLPERDGVLVREVEEGSPAANAGMREGDMIVAAAGKAIVEPDDIYDALGSVSAGGTLQVSLVRGADDTNVEVRFDETAASAEENTGPIH